MVKSTTDQKEKVIETTLNEAQKTPAAVTVTAAITTTIAPTIDNENYKDMIQNNATNTISRFSGLKKHTTKDPFNGKFIIKSSKNFALEIEFTNDASGKKDLLSLMTVPTQQLFNFCLCKLTEKGLQTGELKIPIKEYMAIKGVKDEKETRKQIKNSLDTLFRFALSFKDKGKKGQYEKYMDLHILSSHAIINSYIIANFDPLFIKMLANSGYLLKFPIRLFRINGRNKNAYNMGYRIAMHKNMNAGKPNEDIIGVKTLLDCTTLPTYEEEKAGKRSYVQNIIDPFEKALNELQDFDVLKWEYCHKNGEPLTKEECLNFNYNIFENLLIKFYLKDYPDQTKRLKRKEEKTKQIERNKKRQANKKNTYKKGNPTPKDTEESM